MWGLADDIAERSAVLDQRCEAIGRDPAEIKRSAQALVLLTDDRAKADAFLAGAGGRAGHRRHHRRRGGGGGRAGRPSASTRSSSPTSPSAAAPASSSAWTPSSSRSPPPFRPEPHLAPRLPPELGCEVQRSCGPSHPSWCGRQVASAGSGSGDGVRRRMAARTLTLSEMSMATASPVSYGSRWVAWYSEVRDAVEERGTTRDAGQQRAAGHEGHHGDERQGQVEAAHVADEVLVEGPVDGDPHPPHAGEVVVERPREALGPDADDEAAGRDDDQRDLVEGGHVGHAPRIDGWAGCQPVASLKRWFDTRKDRMSSLADAGVAACTTLGTVWGGLTPERLGEDPAGLGARHRLVVGHVVGPARCPQRRHHRGPGILRVDERGVALGRAEERVDPAASGRVEGRPCGCCRARRTARSGAPRRPPCSAKRAAAASASRAPLKGPTWSTGWSSSIQRSPLST